MASKVTSSTQAHVLRTKRPSGLDMAIVQDLVETCAKVQNGLPAGRSSAAAPPPPKKNGGAFIFGTYTCDRWSHAC